MGALPVALARARRLQSRRIASQKLFRAPCWPCKTSRLTWASKAAAWSCFFAGRQVRCRLNRRAAVARSLSSTRDKNPRSPYGRPIKRNEVGRFPQSFRNTGDARKHHGIARASQISRWLAASQVAFVPGVPQLGGPAQPHGAGLAQGGRRRDEQRGADISSRAHSSSVPS